VPRSIDIVRCWHDILCVKIDCSLCKHTMHKGCELYTRIIARELTAKWQLKEINEFCKIYTLNCAAARRKPIVLCNCVRVKTFDTISNNMCVCVRAWNRAWQ
jgi:hypothetical protein